MPRPQADSQALTAVAAAASVVGLLSTVYYLDIPSMFQQRVKSRKVESSRYKSKDTPSLAAFKTLTQQTTLKETYPLAEDIQKNIVIYDCSTIKPDNEQYLEQLQSELYHCLHYGPGVFVMKNFFTDLGVIDDTSAAYDTIIKREIEENGAAGDHFAAAGSNNRIWNSFSKHCLQDPESFVKYYSNPMFKIVCDAYLGPAYRITSQVNIVKPGGKPQTSHRDYHLGFQTADDTAKFPKATHIATQLLTLQGAVAHSDMPLDSGPTRFLPFSQMFEQGYMAYRRPEFDAYFLESWVSLPLTKGDAVFFNPALFHGAGENVTKTVNRSANLIQVSSAFGKPMETVDALPLVEKCWDAMARKYRDEGMSAEVDALIRAVGEGYPFPTNLDRRPPAPGGMAPESEQDLLRRGLQEGWDQAKAVEELQQLQRDSRP